LYDAGNGTIARIPLEQSNSMASRNDLRAILAEGRCTQGPGRAFDVAMMALEQPRLARSLLECLWDPDDGVAGRAADALETLVGERPQVLNGWKAPLLGLLVEARSIKLRWHLGLIVLRLDLTPPECRRVAGVLNGWLDHPSSIVKTTAMQGLAELARREPSLAGEVLDLLRALTRSGTPAMRARGRTLLRQMEKGGDLTWRRVRRQAAAASRLVH
jgi:hypothetical protein